MSPLSLASLACIEIFWAASGYFYSFRILILSQFKDRTFECPGVTGVLRNQVPRRVSGDSCALTHLVKV